MVDLRILVCALFCLLAPAAAMSQDRQPVRDIPASVPAEYHHLFHKRESNSTGIRGMIRNIPTLLREEPGPSFALIAGVSRYPLMRLSKDRDLPPARVDVDKLSTYLSSDPENFDEVVVLLDEDMTLNNLRYFLTDYFPSRLKDSQRSRFLFAYSGHGITTDHTRGYLLTPKARSFRDESSRARISLEELRAAFRPILDEGHQVLILINACYGASFHQDTATSFGGEDEAFMRPGAMDPTVLWKGAHAISAAGDEQQSFHLPKYGPGSIFFEALLYGLDGRADTQPRDGVISINELRTYFPSAIGRIMRDRQIPIVSDLNLELSPGGFFFLDRRNLRQAGLLPDIDIRDLLGFGDGGGDGPVAPFRDCPGCPEMIVMPSGNFQMGSESGLIRERPIRRIEFAEPFAIARHEVSVAAWQVFTTATGYHVEGSCRDAADGLKKRADRHWLSPGFAQTEDHPVVCVGWHDARAYATWMSERTGNVYRLPTEAEWEYAARFGEPTGLPWDRADAGKQCAHANGADTSVKVKLPDGVVAPCNDGYAFTAPATLSDFTERSSGLDHMIGNVQEWVADCYMKTLKIIPTDGSETSIDCSSKRATRGGSGSMSRDWMHPSARVGFASRSLTNFIGFRLMREM